MMHALMTAAKSLHHSCALGKAPYSGTSGTLNPYISGVRHASRTFPNDAFVVFLCWGDEPAVRVML